MQILQEREQRLAARRPQEHSKVCAVQSSMKQTLTRLVFPITLAAALLCTGCAAQKDTRQLGKALGPVYETAEQIKAMPRCKARVVERGPCYVHLETADGKGFYLGSPGSNGDVIRFVAVLNEGQYCEFPHALVE